LATISDDEEAVLARLDAAFAGQRAALSARQLAVVRAWQRTAREYELARSEIDLDRMPSAAASAFSVLRRVAIEEFTAPGGALLEVVVPAGVWAMWVAGPGLGGWISCKYAFPGVVGKVVFPYSRWR
jgi:hypothetical protein